MKRHLFNTGKIDYVKGEKPDVPCILCAIRDKNDRVTSLEVIRTDNFITAVNLYPFNPGQLMIFPMKHVISITDLTDTEVLEMHHLMVRGIRIIQDEFNPTGFNVGYNLGENSGASVAHIHLHVVPRYGNEVGFMEVMAGTKLIVTDPREVMDRLKKGFNGYAP